MFVLVGIGPFTKSSGASFDLSASHLAMTYLAVDRKPLLRHCTNSMESLEWGRRTSNCVCVLVTKLEPPEDLFGM